jgi:uncharacterized membrane protein YdjX (TVP38/TMEM64 family)
VSKAWPLIRRFGPIALILGLLVAFVASGALSHLSLDELKSHRAGLTAQVAAHPILSLGAYFLLYVLVVVACVPGPGFLSTAGGFLFGVWIGGAAALAACVVGSAIVFLACRTAFGDWAQSRAGPIVQRIEAGFSQNPFSYLLTLRLIPMVPFFATNVAAGLARAPLGALVGATVIGTAPAAFVFAGLGAGLGTLFDRGARVDFTLLETPQIMLPLGGLALLSLLPIAWRLWRSRRTPR